MTAINRRILLITLLSCMVVLATCTSGSKKTGESLVSEEGVILLSRVAATCFDRIDDGRQGNIAVLDMYSYGPSVQDLTAAVILDSSRPAYISKFVPREVLDHPTGWKQFDNYYYERPGSAVIAGLVFENSQLSGLCYTHRYRITGTNNLDLAECKVREIAVMYRPDVVEVAFTTADRTVCVTSPAGMDIADYGYLYLPTRFWDISYAGQRGPVEIAGATAYYICELNTVRVFYDPDFGPPVRAAINQHGVSGERTSSAASR